MRRARKQAKKKPSRKPPRKKSTHAKGQPGKPTTPRQREAMYRHWCKCQNLRQTARHYNKSPTTVTKISKADHWADRHHKNIDKVRALSDSQVVRGIAENLRKAQEILDRVSGKLLDKNENLDADVHSFVRLAKYIDEASGDTPPTPGRDIIINVVERVINGTDAEREQFSRNYLAGFGIFDKRSVDRLSQVLPGPLHSPDGN